MEREVYGVRYSAELWCDGQADTGTAELIEYNIYRAININI